MSGTWCTIESDPGVFTELIESIGVHGVQVGDQVDYHQQCVHSRIADCGLYFRPKQGGQGKSDTSTCQ
ncbi:unnamed protein product [Ectocarpus sp. 4 AP-2014]